MQEHIGGALRVGALIGADDAVEAQHRLDRIAFEPRIEEVAGRLQHEVEEVAPRFGIEPAEPPTERRGFEKLRKDAPACGEHVRRGLQNETAKHVGNAVEPRRIVVEPLCILRGELRHLRLCLAGADAERAAVGERKKVRKLALHDPEPVRRQREVADDLRIEQRDRVGSDGVAEARMEFLRHRRTADDRAALQHRDLQPRGCEIGGADEPVMPAPDDHGIGLDGARTARFLSPLRGGARGGVLGHLRLQRSLSATGRVRCFGLLCHLVLRSRHSAPRPPAAVPPGCRRLFAPLQHVRCLVLRQ